MRGVTYLMVLLTIKCSLTIKFRRRIDAVGFSYYKILLTLGTCKETTLFTENKIWGSVFMNRVLDVYYKSGVEGFKVSKVEIFVVINHSDVLVYSEKGVGYSEFSATVYLPSNTIVVFYSIKIYTCSRYVSKKQIIDEDVNPPLAGAFKY